MSLLSQTYSGWDPQAVFSSKVQKANMTTEPDEYTLNTLTQPSKRKGHRYSSHLHDDDDDDDDDDHDEEDYSLRLVPEPQPHDSLSEPMFVRRSISMKQQGLFDSLDRSSSFVPSSSSMMKSHSCTSLRESNYHNMQEDETSKEEKRKWSAAKTIQKHVRGHLGRRVAAKQQLLQERNRLKSRQRKQQLRQETVQHQQSRLQKNIPFERPVVIPIDEDQGDDVLEDSLMIRRSAGQFHVINPSISNNQEKEITSEWLETQKEGDHDTINETNETLDDDDNERMHVLEDSLIDCRNGIIATDGKTALANIRCSTTTVTTTIQPPSTSCTATTTTAMSIKSSVMPCAMMSQQSILSPSVHVVPAKVAAKRSITTQQQQQQQQEQQQPQQQHQTKAVPSSQPSSVVPSTHPKPLPSSSSTPCHHFPPSVDDLLEATTIVTQSIGVPSIVTPSVATARSNTPMSRIRRENCDNATTTGSSSSRAHSQQRNNHNVNIPTSSLSSHQSPSQRRPSPQTRLQPPPPQQQQQQQPLPPQQQAVSSATAQGTRARARSVSCTRGSQHSQSSQPQMVLAHTLTPRQPQPLDGHHPSETITTTATTTATPTTTAKTAATELTTRNGKSTNIGVTVNVAAMVPPPPTTIPSSSSRTSQVGHRHKGTRTAQGQSNIRQIAQSNLPVKLIAEGTNADEQKLLSELYELEHRQQQKLQDMMKIKNNDLYSMGSTEGETQRKGVHHSCREESVSKGNQENTSENQQKTKEEKRSSSRFRGQHESSIQTTTSTLVSNNRTNSHIHQSNMITQDVTKEHLEKEKKAFKPGARDVRKPSPTFATTTHNPHHDKMVGKYKNKGKGTIHDDNASSCSTTTTTTKSHTHLSSAPPLPCGIGGIGGGTSSKGNATVNPLSNHHHVEVIQLPYERGDGTDLGTNNISRGIGIAEMQGLPSQGDGYSCVGVGGVITTASAYGCVNLLPGMAPGYLLEYQKKRSNSVERTRKISSFSTASTIADDHSVVSALTLHTGIPR